MGLEGNDRQKHVRRQDRITYTDGLAGDYAAGYAESPLTGDIAI